MTTVSAPSTGSPEGRHSLEWYEQRGTRVQLRLGDRLFISCEGGPCASRLETFPPRLEIKERGGTYVLVDDGRVDQWRYVFHGNKHRVK